MTAALILIGLFSFNLTHAQVLATVGKKKISVQEFNHRYDELKKQMLTPPSPAQFLEDMIRYELALQEAAQMGLADEPMVKERLNQVLYNSLLEKDLGQKIAALKASESELKDFYKKNPELHLAYIVIASNSQMTAEQRQAAKNKALDILNQAKKEKRPFEELARLYSDDTSTKETGGDVGFQPRSALLPPIYNAALKMKDGEIQGLIETPMGFYIIKMMERRPFDLADKRQVQTSVIDIKRNKLVDEYFENTKKAYKVHINQETLKSVDK